MQAAVPYLGPSTLMLYTVGALAMACAAGVWIGRSDLAWFGAAAVFTVLTWSDQREWWSLARWVAQTSRPAAAGV